MQKWLKRAGLILFFGLWAAAGLQIWAKKQENKEMEAVAAFSEQNSRTVSCSIMAD